MAEPLVRAPGLKEHMDKLTNKLFGRTTEESVLQDVCVMCGRPALTFNDSLSRRDYRITGMCQMCQDTIYSGEES